MEGLVAITAVSRRRSPRIEIPSSSAVLGLSHRPVLALVNLSASGALLRGTIGPRLKGTLQVLVTLDGGASVTLCGRIVRTSMHFGDTADIAVAFAAVPASTRSQIREIVTATLRSQLSESGVGALIVGGSSALRQPIRAALVWHGVVDVTEASSPLNALFFLAGHPARQVTAFVGPPVGEIAPAELAVFIAREFPRTRVVLLSADQAQPIDVGVVDSAGLLIDVLSRPWNGALVASLMLHGHEPPPLAASHGQ
jgi:hypothetical protein